jgi:hypothetical protein
MVYSILEIARKFKVPYDRYEPLMEKLLRDLKLDVQIKAKLQRHLIRFINIGTRPRRNLLYVIRT